MTQYKRVDFFLLRHGETEWNRQGRLQGQLDSRLSAFGMEQAQAAARRMAQEPIDRVITSDLGRTVQTAECVTDALGLGNAILDPGFRERHLGLLQGLAVSELTVEERNVYNASRHGAADYSPPGGESRLVAQSRIVSALQRLTEEADNDETLCIVTHGGVLGLLLMHVLGVPLTGPRPFPVMNCSLHHVRFEDGGSKVHVLGEISHLR